MCQLGELTGPCGLDAVCELPAAESAHAGDEAAQRQGDLAADEPEDEEREQHRQDQGADEVALARPLSFRLDEGERLGDLECTHDAVTARERTDDRVDALALEIAQEHLVRPGPQDLLHRLERCRAQGVDGLGQQQHAGGRVIDDDAVDRRLPADPVDDGLQVGP